MNYKMATIQKMKIWHLVFVSFLVCCALFPFQKAFSASKTAEVSAIRLGVNGNTTRLVIEMSEAFDYSYLSLDNPYRIVIDLPEVDFNLDATAQEGKGKGLVEQFRFGLFMAGKSRVVLDLNKPSMVSHVFILPKRGDTPNRLVFDLVETNVKTFKQTMGKTPVKQAQKDDTPVRSPSSRPTKRASNKRVIIVDAGHGGIDPGNLGIIGVPEKNIVLNIAKAIRDALSQNPNYEVHMTRDRDIFIPLGDRVKIARKAEADLFISVHADSFKQSSVGGATLYTLSERSSDAESARLARKENRSDLIAGIDLRGETDEVTSILIDLAQRETMNYSARFANLLLPKLSQQIRMRTNSHRYAAFQVLKAPDVPSILIEAGYLTNKDDANTLNSNAGRIKIANSVRSAVDAYFATLSVEGY